jgi:hypothetical protein
VQTIAVRSFVHTFQRKADERKLRVPIGSLSKKQLLLIRRHRLICDILGFVSYGLASLFHGGQHGALQQGLLLEEFFLEAPYVLGRLGHFT